MGIRTLLILCSYSLLFSCIPQKPKEKLPNFIHIFCDDLGYGDIACFGATDIKTPNIDRMAQEGVRFSDFYSASSVCSPSRAALLTGRMPQRMGINAVFFPESFTGMSPNEITIAEMLKKKSYATGMVGKWHLGHQTKFLPRQQGFDYYYGIPYSNDMESVVYLNGNDVDSFKVDQHYITKTYTEKAKSYIKSNKNNPFFLYLAHNMPHVPIYASPEFQGKSERGLYGDVIQELDWSVGEILKQLEDLDLLENTLVVFSSDNGPWTVMEDHGGSAGPLHGGKMYTFEGGMRVPTLALWKGTILEGKVISELATQMDWFPTFAKLAGIELDPNRIIDGYDISPLLKGTGKRESDEFIYYNYDRLTGYRKGNYKIKEPFEGYKGSPWKQAEAAHDTLLINLKDDVGERNNLLKTDGEKVQELYGLMKHKSDEMGPFPPSLFIRSGADNSHIDYLKEKHKLNAN